MGNTKNRNVIIEAGVPPTRRSSISRKPRWTRRRVVHRTDKSESFEARCRHLKYAPCRLAAQVRGAIRTAGAVTNGAVNAPCDAAKPVIRRFMIHPTAARASDVASACCGTGAGCRHFLVGGVFRTSIRTEAGTVPGQQGSSGRAAIAVMPPRPTPLSRRGRSHDRRPADHSHAIKSFDFSLEQAITSQAGAPAAPVLPPSIRSRVPASPRSIRSGTRGSRDSRATSATTT
jgi:hypothetical protein